MSNRLRILGGQAKVREYWEKTTVVWLQPCSLVLLN